MVEVFVVRVFAGGKVAIPKRVPDLLGVEDGDYVRLRLVEVVKKTERKCGKGEVWFAITADATTELGCFGESG